MDEQGIKRFFWQVFVCRENPIYLKNEFIQQGVESFVVLIMERMVSLIGSIILTICFSLTSFSQEIYTVRKGSRFFPGHLHIVISLDSSEIHYQLFNHWYSLSYAQHRDIKIPFSELEKYGEQNDTLTIILLENKVKLIDKKNKLDSKIKHQKLCASLENMRKISYANSIAEKYEDMMHFHLYEFDDLKLTEEEFKKLVDKNVEEEIKKNDTPKND